MMFGRKKKISFSQAVEATHWLLVNVGERNWVGHFAKHRNGSAAGFGSVFGGMGSFNDLVICRANKHQVEAHQEPLANQLLRSLSSICYATSQRGDLTAAEALAACGTIGHELQGWRCRDCGYGRISSADLNALAAYYDVAQAIEGGITSGAFLDSIQNVWARLDANGNVSRFRPTAERSGIRFLDDTGWMRPCPECGSDNTCVYRWDFDGRGFWPSSNNLAMKST